MPGHTTGPSRDTRWGGPWDNGSRRLLRRVGPGLCRWCAQGGSAQPCVALCELLTPTEAAGGFHRGRMAVGTCAFLSSEPTATPPGAQQPFPLALLQAQVQGCSALLDLLGLCRSWGSQIGRKPGTSLWAQPCLSVSLCPKLLALSSAGSVPTDRSLPAVIPPTSSTDRSTPSGDPALPCPCFLKTSSR